MRNKKIFLVVSLLLFCFVLGTVMGFIYVKKTTVIQENVRTIEEESVLSTVSLIQSTTAPIITPKPTEKPESSFFVCISDDEIHIYEMLSGGSMQLHSKSDVDIKQLRQDDYEKLCRGIVVRSLLEAKALAEDFGS